MSIFSQISEEGIARLSKWLSVTRYGLGTLPKANLLMRLDDAIIRLQEANRRNKELHNDLAVANASRARSYSAEDVRKIKAQHADAIRKLQESSVSSKFNNEIKIKPLSMVDQGLVGFEMDLMGEVSRQVASLQDQVVRQQLEKAGWLSPEAAAALRAQVVDLTKSTHHLGACIADDKLFATVIRRSPDGTAQIVLSEQLIIDMLRRHDVMLSAQQTPPPTRPVYLVATGEVHEGQETYTRHDAPVPLADQEVLFTRPPGPLLFSQRKKIADAVGVKADAQFTQIVRRVEQELGVKGVEPNAGIPASESLKFCGTGCGEGVTSFCRGKVAECPLHLPVPGKEGGAQ